MIRATIYLPRYDWYIYAYIAVATYYCNEILCRMQSIGANRESLDRAEMNMTSNHLNNGLTYTNTRNHETIWVVQLTSSPAEFFNTIVHEIRHVQQHISNAFHLDPNSEEVCYLCGDIAKQIYPHAAKLLCDCKNKYKKIV